MTVTTGRPPLVLPRFGTARDESRDTYGTQVGEVARRLGIDPMPHQQYIWDVALEHDDDGRLFYDEADLSTMRQTSKTTTMFVKKVWRLTVAAQMWGPQRSTYTMQKRASARNKLEKDFAEILLRGKVARKSFREIKNPKARPQRPSDWKISLNNGSEHIQFGHGNYLQIDAPTATAGHGDTLDDGDIDEAFAHEDDRVEQAMRPAQATRWNPQLWVGSTAGDHRSKYWYGKVLAGRQQCLTGVRSRTAYFEWSIPDDADIDDEAVWWEFMPALGHTISPEFIRAELERARRNVTEGGENLWRRAYGNQWTEIPILGETLRPVKLPADKWAATVGPDLPVEVPMVALVFDVDKDSASASLAWSARTLEEPYVEVKEHRRGTGWLPAAVVDAVREHRPAVVACNGAGPAGAMVNSVQRALNKAHLDVDVVQQTAREYTQACGAFYTDVVEGRLSRPSGQGPLDAAAADAAERVLGDAWAWDRRNVTVPISPLVAVTIARSLLPAEIESEFFVYTSSRR